jgi:hypothetical protein
MADGNDIRDENAAFIALAKKLEEINESNSNTKSNRTAGEKKIIQNEVNSSNKSYVEQETPWLAKDFTISSKESGTEEATADKKGNEQEAPWLAKNFTLSSKESGTKEATANKKGNEQEAPWLAKNFTLSKPEIETEKANESTRTKESDPLSNLTAMAREGAKNIASRLTEVLVGNREQNREQKDVPPPPAAIPDYARMQSSRKVTVETVKSEIRATGIERASIVNNSEEIQRDEAKRAVVAKLRVPLIFNGTRTVGDDTSVTYDRDVLGGAFKRTQVYEEKDKRRRLHHTQ